MTSPVLCLVTPGLLEPRENEQARAAAVVRLADAAIDAGVDLVQVREPHLSPRVLFDVVQSAVRRARGTPTRVIVNDRLDVALAARADGVHLRSRSIGAPEVREIAPPGFLVGQSVHGTDDAEAVLQQGGVDYLIAGTTFATRSKPGQVVRLGTMGLSAIVAAVRVPVLAIGGIGFDNLPEVAGTGAAGFAAIGLFRDAAAAGTLAEAVARARQAFDMGRAIP